MFTGKRVIGLDAFPAYSLSFKSTIDVFYLTSLSQYCYIRSGIFWASLFRG
jgi:hypothetical protein